MAYLSLTSYTYRSTSNPNFFTTPKRLFITSALFNAVVVGIVVASSLPLKGPAVPLLCVYVGFQLSTPFYLTTLYLPILPSGLPRELLLPLFTTTIEYCHSRIFPYGSYGIMPYTQYGVLPVMQLASVGGVWMVEVFMSYVSGTAALITASVKSSGLDGASVGSLKRLMIVVTIVFLHGGLRLRYLTWEGAPNAPGFTTMRVAGVWLKNTMVIREALLRHHLGHLVDGLPGPGEGMDTWNGRGWEEVKAWSKEDLDVLEEEVKREALSGADVIMTPELALVTFQGPGVDEGDDMSTEFVLERLAKIARDNGVYLGVGIGYNEPFVKVKDLSKFTETVLEKDDGMMGVESNRFILVSPTAVTKEKFNEVVNGVQPHANLALNYIKYNPVPIIEGPFAILGNTTIPISGVDLTGSGLESRVGSVVCFDMEHPWHVKQMSLSTDVVLNPSYDWPGLNPYHARITAFRAVELGSNVFHHCQAGTTAAFDYLGNAVSMGDFFAKDGSKVGCKPLKPEQRCRPGNIVANLPTKGVWTVYGYTGDWVPVVCAIGVAWVVWRGRKGVKVD